MNAFSKFAPYRRIGRLTVSFLHASAAAATQDALLSSLCLPPPSKVHRTRFASTKQQHRQIQASTTSSRWLKKDPSLEPFDRTADYNYSLTNLVGGSTHNINLTSKGFAWPKVNPGADTAFLECTLKEDGRDTYDDNDLPSIRARGGGGIDIIQYFEAGGRGRRYLDLSPLLAANVKTGALVELTSSVGGGTCCWQIGQTLLTTFTNPPIEERRVLVLSPHPDDAEIAAYGLYTSSPDANVVTITAGDAGRPKFGNLWSNPDEQYRAKGRIRTIDSLAVPLLGGLRPKAVRNLGYYDGTLRALFVERPNTVEPKFAVLEEPGYFRRFNFEDLCNRPFESSWGALVADLILELETVRPEVIVVPHPYLDRHIDHHFTAIALFEALLKCEHKCDIYFYTNHATGNEAYPLGPRHGMMGLPAWNEDNSAPLHLTGLYSHPLSKEDQCQKLVALEAMHDLRPFDLRDGSHVVEIPPTHDYFRRAARPNEIFFVTDIAGAKRVYRDFLAGYE